MSTVTLALPVPGTHPEQWSAFQLLARAGLVPTKVLRIYAAGDPEALADAFGLPRETILFVSGEDKLMTALLTRDGKVLVTLEGWPCE